MSLIGKSIDRYHILEQLGEGGMFTVYKAIDTRLEREVAVKLLRAGLFGSAVLERLCVRFEGEARAVARLMHPNIVHMHDYGEHEGRPYLVMEYLPGGTLKTKLAAPTPWRAAVQLLIPVAEALAYAHENKVIHCNIKPSNILLTDKGQSMLTDFGNAKISDLEDDQTLIAAGVGVGTPEYMAPEQGLGKTVDARADVYALGVVLYELITGRKPFQADTPMAVVFKQMTALLPRPSSFVPELPAAVENLLIKALSREPDNRYPDMAAMAVALVKAIRGVELPAFAPETDLTRDELETAPPPVLDSEFARALTQQPEDRPQTVAAFRRELAAAIIKHRQEKPRKWWDKHRGQAINYASLAVILGGLILGGGAVVVVQNALQKAGFGSVWEWGSDVILQYENRREMEEMAAAKQVAYDAFLLNHSESDWSGWEVLREEKKGYDERGQGDLNHFLEVRNSLLDMFDLGPSNIRRLWTRYDQLFTEKTAPYWQKITGVEVFEQLLPGYIWPEEMSVEEKKQAYVKAVVSYLNFVVETKKLATDRAGESEVYIFREDEEATREAVRMIKEVVEGKVPPNVWLAAVRLAEEGFEKDQTKGLWFYYEEAKNRYIKDMEDEGIDWQSQLTFPN